MHLKQLMSGRLPAIFCLLWAAGCASGGTGAGLCGNGILDPGETCDGPNLNGESCTSLGYGNGTLACAADCTIDISGCDGMCTDQCGGTSETRCVGNTVENCVSAGAGCLIWRPGENCQDQGLLCDDSSGAAVCTDTCTDVCTAGQTQCQGDVVQECQAGDNGCTQWKDAENCGDSGGTCVDDGSQATCRPPCTDECTTAGITQCVATVVQICAADIQGCLVWEDTEDCDLSGRQCSDGACQCPVICQAGQTRCSGNVVQDCVAGSNGCLDWADQTDCAAQSMVCDSSGGTATCAATCSDACTAGQTQCVGNTLQDCQTAPSGCLDWVDIEDCAASSRSCSSGACVCNNDCSSGQTQCAGNVVQTCAADSYGCYHWQNGTNCAANGQVCANGACVPTYTQTFFTGTFSSIATTGTDVTGGTTYMDDGRWGIALPFTVQFYGVSYTSAWMCTNGWLSFGGDPGTNVYSNTALPAAAAPNQAVYPFWDDLVYDEAEWTDAAMVYRVTGSSPNRVLTVEWYNLRRVGTGGTSTHRAGFQVKIYETTNVIEFIYNRSNWIGPDWTATIGLEDDSIPAGMDIGTAYVQPPTQDVRFTPN